MSNTTEFAADFALNNLSFGQTSVAILREAYTRGLQPNVFPLNGVVDIGAQKHDEKFNQWLGRCINKAQKDHSRSHTAFKLWHISNSLQSYSAVDSRLITFFELDSLTPLEINILRNQQKVYVTSTFTKEVFKTFGVNSEYIPLGFDSHNFHVLEKRLKIEGVTSWLMCGKWELRKGHAQMLQNWVKKYGNNRAHRLNLSITNQFMKPEHLNAVIAQTLEGKSYWNVNFLPWSATNAEYNSVLQSSDIILSCSRGEGRDLPCYHATAMGAWPVALRAHAFLDYLTDDNAILINPNGKMPAADGVFFGQNGPTNSGNFFTWSDDEFVAACELAEKKAATGLNVKGLDLQRVTYADTLDALLA